MSRMSTRVPIRVPALAGLVVFLATVPVWGQQTPKAKTQAKPQPVRLLHHDVSSPLAELIRMMPPVTKASDGAEVPLIKVDRPNVPSNRPSAPDSLRQTSARPIPGAAPTPGPILQFDGLSDADNANVVGITIVPPDTEGDVGTDFYVQYINLVFRIYDKATGNPVTAPAAGNAFWAGFGGACGSPAQSPACACQLNNDGDPIVLFDHVADQWLFSQFSIDEGVQCFAISQGSNPQGPYFRYAFLVTPGGGNDYPKIGLWTDGGGQSAYHLSLRDFDPSFNTSAVALERDVMLAGGANPQGVKFANPCTAVNCVDAMQPPHLEGPPPPAGAQASYFVAWDDDFDGPFTGTDGYRNYRFFVDWNNLANSTFTEQPIVASAGFNRAVCGFFQRNCIPQPAPGERLDPFDEATMYRAQVRSFGSHNSVVLNHTIDANGADLAGVRWAELRQTTLNGPWSLFQEGTFSPDNLHRWMGSIAMDQVGNVALGYSVSSADVFPSVRYVTRMASDPLGLLPGGEQECVAGTGAQTASANRWGDYSTMSVDPVDGCTFWYTQEYYETNSSFNFRTRICSFKMPNCPGGGGGPTLQLGSVTIDERIRTVALSGFTSPVVVMGPLTILGSDPSTIRVRNVSAASFDHNLQEWDYLAPGNHLNETSGYLALEAGATTLGTLAAEAGTVSINHNWTTVNFNQSFAAAPVVLAQLASFNGNQAAATRIRNVTASSFQVRLQEEEGNDGTHAVESVHWVAVETGSATVGANTFVVGRTGNSVTHAFSTINFGQTLSNPIFLAAMQTFDGSDPATLRQRNLSTTSVQVQVDEEQSLDTEVNHTTEVVGWIAISR